MKRMPPVLAVFLLLTFSLTARGVASESYFPLKEGMVWEYQHTYNDLKSQKQIGTAKSIKKNLAPRKLQDREVVPQVFSFYQPENVLKQETTSFIRRDATGFQVVARQSAEDAKPVFQANYYILKFPLTRGASWQQEAEGFLVRDVIESLDASVKVKAGVFNHCLVMKKLYFDPKDPGTPIQEVLFWFAPEVGNIRAVTRHPQKNVEIVQELVSVQK